MWSMASEEPRAGRMRGLRQTFCERLNIPCHVHSVDVPQYAKSHGLGLEEAARILRYEAFEKEVARILRYEAFEEEAGRYPCETADASDQKQGNSRQAVVAVAHHMEDNAETVLFQMLRGSGAKGLAGMHPVSVKNGVTYIRPLLSATRAQIEEYLKENGSRLLSPMPQTLTQPTPEISCAMMCFHCFCRLMTGRLSISMRVQDSLR